LCPDEWEIKAKQLIGSPFATDWEIRFCYDILSFYAGKSLSPRHFETREWTWDKCRDAKNRNAYGGVSPRHV
jgi:hypothetical protein